MNRGTTGSIKVRPYLAAYTRWRENLAPDQPLLVPGCSPIALALDLCLTNKTTYLASRAVGLPDEKYGARLRYTVAGSRDRDGFLFVTDAMALRFNSFLLHDLHNLLADRIFRAVADGGSEKLTLLGFMREVGIEELVEYDALKKANYRLRTHRGFSHGRGRNWTYSPTAMQFIHAQPAPKSLPVVPAQQLRLAL